MVYEAIPESELQFFRTIKDPTVIFDVGARDNLEYYRLHPEAEFHLFEPNMEFFDNLKAEVGDKPNIHLNNFGLSDEEGEGDYHTPTQAFLGGDAKIGTGDKRYNLRTLDSYVDQHNIDHIDFLKIDTEGYDYKVLCGAAKTIPKCKYIQYEHWDTKEKFHQILEKDFYMTYIGGRNVFCTRKDQPL